MGFLEHSAFQLVQLFLFLVLVFRVLLGAPFTALFLLKWLGVGAVSILGLSWASGQVATAYLSGIALLCLVLIWHDLWPDDRRVGKLEVAGGIWALLVYGGFLVDFLSAQRLTVYFQSWGAMCTLVAVALLRQFVLEFGLRADIKMGVTACAGVLMSLAGGILSWTSQAFEAGAMVLLAAFLLLGYLARGNAKK